MIPPKVRTHLYTTVLFSGICVAAYGAYKAATEVRKWSNATPRLQHQEMEDFLRNKEEQNHRFAKS